MIARDVIKFRPMSNGQGRMAQLPNGGKVFDWDEKHFAPGKAPMRFQRIDVAGDTVAEGPTLRDVMPELVDDAVVERLRKAGKVWSKARESEREAAAAAYAAIVEAHAAGLAETRIAAIAGVDRMTVRKALGKR